MNVLDAFFIRLDTNFNWSPVQWDMSFDMTDSVQFKQDQQDMRGAARVWWRPRGIVAPQSSRLLKRAVIEKMVAGLVLI